MATPSITVNYPLININEGERITSIPVQMIASLSGGKNKSFIRTIDKDVHCVNLPIREVRKRYIDAVRKVNTDPVSVIDDQPVPLREVV